MGRVHRATGNPRGRPSRLPWNFGQKILDALKRREDPETGLVRPLWAQLARELGVSRSTLARQLAKLRASGAYEVVTDSVRTEPVVVYYRLKD